MDIDYLEMNREELLDLVSYMRNAALDIGQNLFLAEKMKPEYREDVYNKTTQMAYDLAFLKVDFDTNFGLTYIGGNGIEHPNEV